MTIKSLEVQARERLARTPKVEASLMKGGRARRLALATSDTDIPDDTGADDAADGSDVQDALEEGPIDGGTDEAGNDVDETAETEEETAGALQGLEKPKDRALLSFLNKEVRKAFQNEFGADVEISVRHHKAHVYIIDVEDTTGQGDLNSLLDPLRSYEGDGYGTPDHPIVYKDFPDMVFIIGDGDDTGAVKVEGDTAEVWLRVWPASEFASIKELASDTEDAPIEDTEQPESAEETAYSLADGLSDDHRNQILRAENTLFNIDGAAPTINFAQERGDYELRLSYDLAQVGLKAIECGALQKFQKELSRILESRVGAPIVGINDGSLVIRAVVYDVETSALQVSLNGDMGETLSGIEPRYDAMVHDLVDALGGELVSNSNNRSARYSGFSAEIKDERGYNVNVNISVSQPYTGDGMAATERASVETAAANPEVLLRELEKAAEQITDDAKALKQLLYSRAGSSPRAGRRDWNTICENTRELGVLVQTIAKRMNPELASVEEAALSTNGRIQAITRVKGHFEAIVEALRKRQGLTPATYRDVQKRIQAVNDLINVLNPELASIETAGDAETAREVSKATQQMFRREYEGDLVFRVQRALFLRESTNGAVYSVEVRANRAIEAELEFIQNWDSHGINGVEHQFWYGGENSVKVRGDRATILVEVRDQATSSVEVAADDLAQVADVLIQGAYDVLQERITHENLQFGPEGEGSSFTAELPCGRVTVRVTVDPVVAGVEETAGNLRGGRRGGNAEQKRLRSQINRAEAQIEDWEEDLKDTDQDSEKKAIKKKIDAAQEDIWRWQDEWKEAGKEEASVLNELGVDDGTVIRENADYQIVATEQAGLAVFANRAFKAGETVVVSTYVECASVEDPTLAHYTWHIDGRDDVIAMVMGDGNVLNHSNTPNCEWRFDRATRQHIMTATREIAAGEELTHYYDWFDTPEQHTAYLHKDVEIAKGKGGKGKGGPKNDYYDHDDGRAAPRKSGAKGNAEERIKRKEEQIKRWKEELKTVGPKTKRHAELKEMLEDGEYDLFHLKRGPKTKGKGKGGSKAEASMDDETLVVSNPKKGGSSGGHYSHGQQFGDRPKSKSTAEPGEHLELMDLPTDDAEEVILVEEESDLDTLPQASDDLGDLDDVLPETLHDELSSDDQGHVNEERASLKDRALARLTLYEVASDNKKWVATFTQVQRGSWGSTELKETVKKISAANHEEAEEKAQMLLHNMPTKSLRNGDRTSWSLTSVKLA